MFADGYFVSLYDASLSESLFCGPGTEWTEKRLPVTSGEIIFRVPTRPGKHGNYRAVSQSRKAHGQLEKLEAHRIQRSFIVNLSSIYRDVSLSL